MSNTSHEVLRAANAQRLLKLEQVRQRTCLGKTATYGLIARNLHPAPVKIGRASLWVEREINDWLEQVVSQRGLGAR